MRALLIIAIVASAACNAYGEAERAHEAGTDGGTSADAIPTADAAVTDGNPATSCNPECKSSGCIEYKFDGACPPLDWVFSGDGQETCESGALHLAAQATKDAIALLQVKMPSALAGAHIELGFTITRWATATGDPGVVFIAGSTNGNTISITALETGGGINLALCRYDTQSTNCLPLATLTSKTAHVLALDWSGTAVTATLDCTAIQAQASIPLGTLQVFSLRFGMPDADLLDGTIRDVKLAFR